MNNLEDTLVEVRKAYRLVQSYQTRILDMTNYIKEYMEYESYWWDNEYFHVRSNKLPCDGWSYDNIPLYVGSGMLFLHKDVNYNHVQIGEGLLEIQFDTDSGFIESKDEPNPNSFAPAEECKSYLYIGAICGLREYTLTDNWLSSVFYKTTYPNIEELEKIYTSSQGEFILFRAKYDLSLIDTEEKLKEILDVFKSKIIGKN